MTDLINPVFIKLQTPNLLVSTQASLLDSLAVDISTMLGISNWENEEGVILLPLCVAYGQWYVDYAVVHKFLQDLGMYIRHTLEELNEDMTGMVLKLIGKLGVQIVEGIVDIQAERDQQNCVDDNLPCVLPHKLVKMSTGDFGKTIIDLHLQQLQHSWSKESIIAIEHEHRELILAYHSESALRSTIDAYACINIESFDTAWKVVEGRFEILHDFCGGIASVFANTASVESDFSILGWERDEYRLSMTDLSLEGVLHCKQYKILQELAI